MKVFCLFSLTTFFITAISSCSSSKKNLIPVRIMPTTVPIYEEQVAQSEEESSEEKPDITPKNSEENYSYQQFFLKVPLSLQENTGLLNADFFEPPSKLNKKILIIMVPGSGNVSRVGEISSDGINTFTPSYQQSYAWSKALTERGFFVLSYDKRTCQKSINETCNDNPQKDINELGILALSSDLDQVCSFAKNEFKQWEKLVLMSTTQGAQVISLSHCLKEASAVVLFSPILENLSDFLVAGLERAALKEDNFYLKTNLLNRKESTKAFFASLEQSKFKKSAQIKGASLAFWESWLLASKNTLKNLADSPVLALFSSGDTFLSDNVLNAELPNLKVIKLDDVDNLLIKNKELSKDAVDAVEQFLSLKIPLS